MMTGYCSNSPLRCSYAKSMTLLSQLDSCCPQCGMALVTNSSLNNSSRVELRALEFGLIIGVGLLIALICIYYAKLV